MANYRHLGPPLYAYLSRTFLIGENRRKTHATSTNDGQYTDIPLP